MRRLVLLLCLVGLTPACGGAAGADPERVLHDYSLAVEGGRAAEAYSLLSSESKKSISFEQFQRILKENPEEARELSQSLRRPQAAPATCGARRRG